MAGASASAVNIPVLARSVGGTSSQEGAIVFRIPGIGHAYTAHVSEDATVFVQSREDVAPSLQCVAVIDAVHLQDDAYRATHGSELLAGEISLHWLGTAEFVLAVVHSNVAHLLSLRAALQNPYQGHSQHHIVARVAADSNILSLALTPCLSSLFLTTADGVLACHNAHKHSQALPSGGMAPWPRLWSEQTPVEHSLLCITSHTCLGKSTVMLTSASATRPSVSVWRLPCQTNGGNLGVAHEHVPVPVPSTAVQFRPHHSAQFTPKELCPPETLIAVGTDGVIRMWVDNDATATMPAALLEAAEQNGTILGPTMCLARSLTPPDLKPMRAPVTISQWAESPSDLPDAQTTSWLVATVYESAPITAEPGPDDEDIPGDQVFVWGVTVLPAAARAPEVVTTGEDSACESVKAACSSPRVTADLWAFDAYRMLWENPKGLHLSSSRRGMRMLQAATAATHDGSPVVALAHLAVSSSGDHAEIRPSILDLVDLKDTQTSLRDGSAMRAVTVHAAVPHQLATVTPQMFQVAVHPSLPLAASVSDSGTATIWSTQPMEIMHDVEVGSEHITAAAWVAHGLASDEVSELATLLTCTPYRLTLQPWKAEQIEVGVDAVALELLEHLTVEIALPEYLIAAGARIHTLQAVPAGSSVVVVMHAACHDAEPKVAAVVLHELSSEPVAEGSCEVLPEAAVQVMMTADAVVAVDGAALLLAVRAGVPPQVSLFDVDSSGLHLHWSDAASDTTERVAAVQADVQIYSAHSSLACSTAALLHGMLGAPVQLSLFKLVDSGSQVSAEPEQTIVLEGRPGRVHVTAVGLGRAAVAVASGRSVTLWFRCTGSSWAPGVRASTPGIAHTLQATPSGILVGLPSQVLLLHPSVSAAGGLVSAGGAAEACSQARALWHPMSLLLLLSRGLYDLAAEALRMLLKRVRSRDAKVDFSGFQQLMKQNTASTLLLATALACVAQHQFPEEPTRKYVPRVQAPGPVRGAAAPAPQVPQAAASSQAADPYAFNPSAFGGMTGAPPAAPNPPAADPHAFNLGAFGNFGATAAPSEPAQPPPPDPHAFDPSAFGNFGAAPSQPQQPPAPPADPHAFDPSAFGNFGGAAPTSPQPAPQPPAPPADPHAFDPSAFSNFGATPPQPQQPPAPPADPHAFDPSAFGNFGAAAPQPQPQQPPPPEDPMAASVLASFGYGGTPPAEPKPAPTPGPVTSGMPDLAAFGFSNAPSASGASTLDAASNTTGTSPYNPHTTEASTHSSPVSNAAQSQEPSQGGKNGGPVAEGRVAFDKHTMHTTDGAGCRKTRGSRSAVCLRAPSFDLIEEDSQLFDSVQSPLRYRGRVLPSSGVCEAIEDGDASPRDSAGSMSPALDILAAADRGTAVEDLILRMDSIETHLVSEQYRLGSEEVKELRKALLTEEPTATRTRARLQLTSTHAHLIVRIAELVSDCGTANLKMRDVAGLDVPGRRALSAACTTSAVLEAMWDEKEASEKEDEAPGDFYKRGRSKSKMSAGASALLEKLKAGGGDAGASSSSGPIRRPGPGFSGPVSGSSAHLGGPSGALSGMLSMSGMSGALSGMSGALPYDNIHSGGASDSHTVHAVAVAAVVAAWSRMHIAPLLRHTVLHWAFDCKFPGGLLDAMMKRMPADERSGMRAYASSSAFASTRAYTTSAWSWFNFRRIGGAFWVRDPKDVKSALEQLNKATFAATKDAQSVALWYVAQGKKNALSTLMRSKSTTIADFLLRDFSQTNHQRAAGKNAHQLVAQHRYPMAAAFFLLSGDVDAAMSTCLDKLRDVQMAIMLARVLDAFAQHPTGNMSHTGTLFDKLLQHYPASTCPVLHGLLLRAAERPFTLQQSTAAASVGYSSCMEAHCNEYEGEGSDDASKGPPANRLVVGPALTMQASDWFMRAVLHNTRTGRSKSTALDVPEVAAMSGREAVEVVGWTSGHASLHSEHTGHPIAALELALRRAAVSYVLQQVPSAEDTTLVAVEAVRSNTEAAGPQRPPSEVDRELLLQQGIAMLHCQGALALGGTNSATWGLAPLEDPGLQAKSKEASSRKLSKLSSLAPSQNVTAPQQVPGPELLFSDGVQLLSAVRGLQGLAAAARHGFEDEQQSAQLLSDLSGRDALEPLQAGGMLPHTDQLGGILQNANTLLSVHVEDVQIPPPVVHPPDGTTSAHREAAQGADGDGTVVEQGLTFSVASVGDKDAQAVSCCVSSLLPLECHLQTVVATKKQGLMFCSTTGSTFCTGVRSCRYTDLHERIVERWSGNPGTTAGTPRKGMCHPMAHAAHAHRVQMVNPRSDACTAQALASHPHQATVLSGSVHGYVHAWRYSDGSLKATYAPLPLSHQLIEASSSSVPQPSQVLHWKYAMSIAYCDSGSRFAAIGKGGWVALWRHDAQWANTAHGRVGCCDWTHQCIGRRGGAVAFVGSRSTLLMAAGVNTDHQDITVWDITVPLSSSRVGVIQTGHHVVDAKVSSDGVTTVTVDNHGDVCGYDMRMLQATISPLVTPGSSRALLWKHERVHAHGATCVSICPHRLKMLSSEHTLVASGGRDGKVCLWSLEAGTQVQTLTRLHATANRGLFTFSHSDEKVACKVKDIDFDAVGLVSVGHDNGVSCVPWSSHP